MTLRYITTKEVWKGEPINGAIFPRTIEKLTGESAAARWERLGLEKVPDPEPVAHVPTAADVSEEADARVSREFPARKREDAQARAIELTLKGQANWTETEAAEAFWLQAARDWIKSVRTAETELSADPPADYQTSDVWPPSFAETAAAIIEAQAGE